MSGALSCQTPSFQGLSWSCGLTAIRSIDVHDFVKPNDTRALQLMDHAARDVMEEYPDAVLAFGESDEYSFLLRKSTALYNRRQSKIVTTLTSLFTSSYVFHWSLYFPNTPLQYPPSFDGRIVLYPTDREVRDYFAWRQADTHINNMYNTVFWALVQQGGETTTQAHATLRGTISSQKQEILFSRFSINYNQVDERFRKGSVLVREEIPEPEPDTEFGPAAGTTTTEMAEAAQHRRFEQITIGTRSEVSQVAKKNNDKKDKMSNKLRTRIELCHCDIIKDEFWKARPRLLMG